MRRVRAAIETIHLGALGLWAGAVLMTGVTAAIAFPTMKALDPALPAFAGFTGDHWMIAAGSVMNKAFLVSDWIGLAGALVGVVTLLLVLVGIGGVRARLARPATLVRMGALAGAVGVTIYSVGVLRPRMQAELAGFWDAARAGDNETAAIHQSAFDDMHPTASALLVAQLALVLAAFGAGGLAALTHENAAGKSAGSQGDAPPGGRH